MISEAMVDRVRQRRVWSGICLPWVLWGGLVAGMTATASAHPRTSAAVETWSARIAGSPEEPLLYVERARQWRLLGSHDRAARDLRRAEGLAPDIAATALEWALLERDRGRHDRAVWWASRAATLDPGWWRPRRLRGELSLERGENSQASLDLVWVATRRGEPDDVALAARALERERRGSAAARLLEEAAATRRAPTLALMAADIHARCGDFQASLMAIGLAEALGLDPFTAAVRVAQALLDAGAAMSAPDRDGDTPLHAAADMGQAAVLRSLLRHGAPADPQNDDGCTPLLQATVAGHIEVVHALLDGGAAVGVSSQSGCTNRHSGYAGVGGTTALHAAAATGQLPAAGLW